MVPADELAGVGGAGCVGAKPFGSSRALKRGAACGRASPRPGRAKTPVPTQARRHTSLSSPTSVPQRWYLLHRRNALVQIFEPMDNHLKFVGAGLRVALSDENESTAVGSDGDVVPALEVGALKQQARLAGLESGVGFNGGGHHSSMLRQGTMPQILDVRRRAVVELAAVRRPQRVHASCGGNS